MNFFVQATAAWVTAWMLFAAAATARADDLEQLFQRQQILNQFQQGQPIQPGSSGAVPSAVPIRTYPAHEAGNADDLIRSAMGLLGVAYRYGGTSASTGFDCSGFMQHIFRRSMGLSLPRTSAEQAQMGVHVNRSELQPGDMVFFRTMGRGRISHVGLYIGNDRFIHAPRTGKNIEITSLSHKYWGAKYAFGRRVKKNDPSRFLN